MRTPRTNAAKEPLIEEKDHPDQEDFILGYLVDAEFAERLEVELMESLDRIEQLKRKIDEMKNGLSDEEEPCEDYGY